MASDADSDLTSEQTESVLQFQDLTGIEDIERCREILELHDWDLEVAVQDTLNIRERDQVSENVPSAAVAPDERLYLALRSWEQYGIIGWSFMFLSYPFQLAYSVILSLARFLFRFIRADHRRSDTDPQADVTNFIQRFETSYGSMHPTFYRSTYYQTLNDARQDLRFLLVYLHGDDHQDTDRFCRRVLCHPSVADYINKTFLFWSCSVNTAEGYRVSQALRENTYPFLAVIVLKDNQMTVVGRLEGSMEPAPLIKRLQLIVHDNQACLEIARQERLERSLNQTIRQQQDAAYEESLRADQEKEKKRREKQEKQILEEMEQRNRILQEQEKKEEIIRKKIEFADLIPAEPPLDDPSTIRVMLKLPNGVRLERRFDRNDSLKCLHYFVFCHDESPDYFQIVTNFPRRVVPCEPTEVTPDPPTFADFGFGRTEMCFVQDLEA